MTSNSAFRSGLVLLLVLAASLGGFWLLRRDDPQGPGVAAAGAASTPTGAAAEPGGQATRAAREPVAPPDPRADAEAGAPRVLATGRLVDPQGRPVAGKEVELQVDVDQGSSDPRVRVLGPDRAKYESREKATSAQDGTFVLHLPAGTSARIAPTGADLVFRAGPLEIEACLSDASVGDIVVQRACSLGGVVRDPSGAPCARVTVLCGAESRNFDEGRAAKAETGADGAFRFAGLANGGYRLLCRSPLHAPLQRTVDLLPEQRVLDVVLTLDPGGRVAGRVVDDAGTPVAGAEVRVAPVRGSGPTLRARSGPDGAFVVGGVADGGYKVTAGAKGHREDRASPVTAEAGARDLTVRLVRATSIAGAVVDEVGRPVAGSRVRAVQASVPVEQDRQQILFNPGVVTGADGAFAFMDLAAGEYRVMAYGPHLEAAVSPVRTAPGQPVVGLSIAVQRGGAVRVRVEAPDGAPAAAARVRVAEQSVPDNDRPVVLMGASGFDPEDLYLGQRVWRATTGQDGEALVTGLTPGTYRVRVASGTGVQERPAIFTLANAGEARVAVRLEAAGFALVEVVDAQGTRLPKRRVEIEGPLALDKPAQSGGDTGADGRVRLGPLAPGRYRAGLGKAVDTDAFGGALLVFSGGGPSFAASRVEIEVQAGATADVRLVRPELVTLRGTVRDGGQGVADARVQIGTANPDRASTKLYGLDGSTRSARTRPDGSFRVADLEPGTYRVRWGRAAQDLLAERTVTLAPGRADEQLDLPVQCGALRLQVRGADHGPLAGAQVRLRRTDDPKPGQDLGIPDYAFPQALTADAKADAQGVAEFACVPFGRYLLEAQAPRHRPATTAALAVEGTATDAGVLELQSASRISGTFVDPSGVEPGAAYAEYRLASAAEFKPSFQGKGKFEIDGLEPGDYVLRARRLSGGQLDKGPPGPEVTVRVEAGAAATVSLRLSAR